MDHLARLRACPKQPSGVLSIGEELLGDAWFQAARDNLPQARALLAEAAGQARATGHLASEAFLLTDIARLGDAASVTDRLHTITEHCDGDLAPARDRFVRALADSDPQSLLASAHELRGIGADLLAAEACTLASVLFRRQSRSRPATFAATLTGTVFEACQGARTPLLAGAEPTSVLTDREQEIALLATSGASSKDIAAELFLSVRTVENYLFRAYKKLGISGRRELTKSLIRSPAAYSR